MLVNKEADRTLPHQYIGALAVDDGITIGRHGPLHVC